MAIEQYTEHLVLKEMECKIGENDFGYVFPQGDISEINTIENILKKMGGKPKECELEDYDIKGKGKAKPEFIITFNEDINTIIVIECKNTVKKHSSEKQNRPNAYAVDGVLYYAKYLKEEYNVIAIAVSGTKKDKMKVDTFYWMKRQDKPIELSKAKNILLEPLNYIKLLKGEEIQKKYSLEEIRELALTMHDSLRAIKVTEKHKPLFIAGILIALQDETFTKTYSILPTYNAVITQLNAAIDNVLGSNDISKSKINYVKNAFKTIGNNEKLKAIPLINTDSLIWYIKELEMKIKPMMFHPEVTLDALGVFYHEFVKYSGGDGAGLGIVLTPQHITEFMCDLANINKNSKVVDICCGSGSFLVTAMSKMFKNANAKEVEKIRRENLYGVELDTDLFTLSIANMIVRKDGKSHIINGDCFNPKIKNFLKSKNINIGLINPPYSQKDICELEFVENLLDILTPTGTGVAIVPMSCAIGTKFKEVRERLLKNHTLKAVFSMPDDLFYPTGTNTCIMLWEAHTPHDYNQETFFGYYKEDGFEKRKKLGRVDYYNKWKDVKTDWLKFYRNREIKDGISAKKNITFEDEWLCEAYMKTDYSNLDKSDFEQTIKDYLAYLIKSGDKYES
ncbi:HsdM family class I SAM-dependent methyltransferase [Clostridium perfringens]|uniref:HsdM family class I SAM-dependent methyltransferase n=1 Tax=Clostridium perfringens TaxID=1502 RepID=UPI0013E338F4|nr:N-6 DNA methylase [Clostridium perfringens]NGT35678.1 N-6 DNA methylase [Clostridium perfringens]